MSVQPKLVLREEADAWIGWVDGIPGVNSQAPTREELIENLRSALAEWHELEQDDSPSVLNPEP